MKVLRYIIKIVILKILYNLYRIWPCRATHPINSIIYKSCCSKSHWEVLQARSTLAKRKRSQQQWHKYLHTKIHNLCSNTVMSNIFQYSMREGARANTGSSAVSDMRPHPLHCTFLYITSKWCLIDLLFREEEYL